MSCCGNKKMQNLGNFPIENYTLPRAQNYDDEAQTYTNESSDYYAAPWPMERTAFDGNLQAEFNTSNIPDFLNYTSGNAPVMPWSSSTAPASLNLNRKSVMKGNKNYYTNYSY